MQRAHCGSMHFALAQSVHHPTLLRAILSGRFEAIHSGACAARGLDYFQLRANATGELTAEYRLSKKVADPEAHPLGARVHVVACGNHDDRDFGGFGTVLERLDDLEAVHIGHHEVEQNYVDFVFMNQFETLRSGGGRYRDKAFALQMVGKNCDRVLIVVNHHNLWRPDCFIHTSSRSSNLLRCRPRRPELSRHSVSASRKTSSV